MGDTSSAVASCAFCHNPNGAGGSKVSWRPLTICGLGNISSDTGTGIGAWNATNRPSHRSGITPDGRTLHWQGMIWDHRIELGEEESSRSWNIPENAPSVTRKSTAWPPRRTTRRLHVLGREKAPVPGCRLGQTQREGARRLHEHVCFARFRYTTVAISSEIKARRDGSFFVTIW